MNIGELRTLIKEEINDFYLNNLIQDISNSRCKFLDETGFLMFVDRNELGCTDNCIIYLSDDDDFIWPKCLNNGDCPGCNVYKAPFNGKQNLLELIAMAYYRKLIPEEDDLTIFLATNPTNEELSSFLTNVIPPFALFGKECSNHLLREDCPCGGNGNGCDFKGR